jgi:hypothetical protein
VLRPNQQRNRPEAAGWVKARPSLAVMRSVLTMVYAAAAHPHQQRGMASADKGRLEQRKARAARFIE